jgi:hypothetical protein
MRVKTLGILEELFAISHGPESQPTSGRRYLARLIGATTTDYTVYRFADRRYRSVISSLHEAVVVG